MRSGDMLESDKFYEVRFVIKDNGEYDLDPREGWIHAPLVLGTEDGIETSSSGGGCTVNTSSRTADMLLLLMAAVLFIGYRRLYRRQ